MSGLPTNQHHAVGLRESANVTILGFAHRLGAWIFAAAIVHGLIVS